MPTDSIIDWDAVELDYRTGILPESEICKKYDISRAKLDATVTKAGWTRTMMTAEDEATILGLAEYPRLPIDSIYDVDDIKRQALMTAGQIVRLHRKDINKMRNISGVIIERLENFLSTGEYTWIAGLLGKNDSPTDLLEKLSRILTRVVTIERQAYGLDTMTIVPDEEEENQVAKDIRKLSNQLALITQQKAQKVEVPDENIRQNNDEAGKEPDPRS